MKRRAVKGILNKSLSKFVSQKIIALHNRYYLIILLILAIAILLRVYNIGFYPFNYDEAIHTFRGKYLDQFAWMRILNIPLYLNKEESPLFYYLIHIAIKLFGVSSVAARIPSLLFGTCIIIVVYLLAAEIFNKHIGLGAAALCALNPFQIVFSQVAYTDVTYAFFMLISILLLLRGIKTNIVRHRNLHFLLAAVFMLLSYYTKYLAGITIFLLLIFILLYVIKKTLNVKSLIPFILIPLVFSVDIFLGELCLNTPGFSTYTILFQATEGGSGVPSPLSYWLTLFGYASFPFLVLFSSICLLKDFNNREVTSPVNLLLLLFWVPIFSLTFLTTKYNPHYVLFPSVVGLILVSKFVEILTNKIPKIREGNPKQIFCVGIILLCIISFSVYTFGLYPTDYSPRDAGEVDDYNFEKIKPELQKISSNDTVVVLGLKNSGYLTKYFCSIAFYTNGNFSQTYGEPGSDLRDNISLSVADLKSLTGEYSNDLRNIKIVDNVTQLSEYEHDYLIVIDKEINLDKYQEIYSDAKLKIMRYKV